MNQKHRVIKPFTSIESYKVAPGNLGGPKSSIPMLPPANARLNPDTIVLQRRGSESSGNGNSVISMPTPMGSKDRNSAIIFTGSGNNSSASGGGGGAMGTKGQVNSLNSNDKVLLRKIAELETQNERLRQQVVRSEGAIKNYRGFMANHHPGGDRADNVPSKSTVHSSCQTVLDGNSVDVLQDKLADAHKRMHSLQSARHHDVPSSMHGKTSPRPVAAEDSAVVQNLRRTVASLEGQVAQCKEREEGMQQQLADAERVSRLHTNSKEENLLLLKQLNEMQNAASSSAVTGHATLQSHAEAVKGLSSGQAEHRAAVQEELQRYQAYLTETVMPQLAAITAVLEQKDAENSALQLQLNTRQARVQTVELEIAALHECLEEEKRMHAELRAIYEELEASVLAKNDTATVTARAVAEVLANAQSTVPAPLPTSASPDKELRRQLAQYELLIAQVRAIYMCVVCMFVCVLCVQCAPYISCTNPPSRQLESKHKSASQEREKHFLRAQQLNSLLATANKHVNTLCDAHAEVVKTVKHSAHVKDLQRVVAAREMMLEKDKAEGEVGHIKEVNSVLSFCLNTVETTLLETNPQVVIRVADGRTRRLQFLEQSRRKRSKDIEQRSQEVRRERRSCVPRMSYRPPHGKGISSVLTSSYLLSYPPHILSMPLVRADYLAGRHRARRFPEEG